LTHRCDTTNTVLKVSRKTEFNSIKACKYRRKQLHEEKRNSIQLKHAGKEENKLHTHSYRNKNDEVLKGTTKFSKT